MQVNIIYRHADLFMIGSRIKEFRKAKGLKIAEFAKIIGISQGSLSDIENGKTKPSADTISSIVRQTDIDPTWFLTGKEGKDLQEPTSEVRLGVDTQLLKSAIEAVEQGLKETKRTMSPNNKAELINAIYELYADTGRQVDKGRVLRLVKSAA